MGHFSEGLRWLSHWDPIAVMAMGNGNVRRFYLGETCSIITVIVHFSTFDTLLSSTGVAYPSYLCYQETLFFLKKNLLYYLVPCSGHSALFSLRWVEAQLQGS